MITSTCVVWSQIDMINLRIISSIVHEWMGHIYHVLYISYIYIYYCMYLLAQPRLGAVFKCKQEIKNTTLNYDNYSLQHSGGNMHMKFEIEIEISKQTEVMLRKSCRLQTARKGKGDSGIPYTPTHIAHHSHSKPTIKFYRRDKNCFDKFLSQLPPFRDAIEYDERILLILIPSSEQFNLSCKLTAK